MKKIQFIILLILEIITGLIGIGILLSNLGIFSYLLGILIFIAILYPFYRRIKKENDEAEKEKIRRKALLVMLIPTALAILAIMYVVISLIIYFV